MTQLTLTDGHEVVSKEIVTPDGDTLAIVVTGNAKQDVKQFYIKDDEITTWKEKATALEIKSINDKDKYNDVYELRQFIKKNRLSIDKVGNILTEGAKEYTKVVTTEQKRIITELKSIETILQAKEDHYEALKAEEQLELERQAERVLTARASQLIDMGLSFTGKYYQVEATSIEHNKLSNFTEKQWEDLIAEIKPICEKIQKEREEAAERAAEAERENARLRAEIERKENRTNQLLKIGLNYTGDAFRLEEIVIESTELTALNDEQWNVLIERVGPVVTERIAASKAAHDARLKEETERKEAAARLNKDRKHVMEAYGVDTQYMDFAPLTEEEFQARAETARAEWNAKKEKEQRDALAKERIRLTNPFLPYMKADAIYDGDFADMSQDAFAQYMVLCEESKAVHEKEQAELRERAEKQKQAEEAKLREEKENEEKAKAAAVAPDIEKLNEIAARFRSITMPALGSVNNELIVETFNAQREKFAAWVEGLSSKL